MYCYRLLPVSATHSATEGRRASLGGRLLRRHCTSSPPTSTYSLETTTCKNDSIAVHPNQQQTVMITIGPVLQSELFSSPNRCKCYCSFTNSVPTTTTTLDGRACDVHTFKVISSFTWTPPLTSCPWMILPVGDGYSTGRRCGRRGVYIRYRRHAVGRTIGPLSSRPSRDSASTL